MVEQISPLRMKVKFQFARTPVVATSHGTAITFGRSIGTQAAAGDE